MSWRSASIRVGKLTEESSATSTWKLRPAAFIDNVRFGYKLNADYSQAACRAQVMVSSLTATSGNIELVLLRAGSEVARAEKNTSLASGASEVEVEFHVNAPALWSPEEPNLYQLHARLETDQVSRCLELAAPGSVKSSLRGRTSC